jgi:hypothetical protein
MSVHLSTSNSKGGYLKPRQFTRYLRCLALVTLCLILLITGFNWFINPYNIYNSPKIAGFNATKPLFAQHLRMAKAYAVRSIKPSAVVLGTSSAEAGIDPSHAGWTNNPVYNLGLSGANIYEITRYMQHANRKHQLKQIVLMLDFFSFNINKQNRSDFNESRLSVSYDGQAQLLFNGEDTIAPLASYNALLDSVKTVIHQKDEGSIYLDNGMLKDRNSLIENGYHASFVIAEESYMTSAYVPGQYDFANSDTGRSSFDYYRKILQIAYQDNIDLRIAISPSHIRQWEVVSAIGLWPRFEEWKRTLVKINEDEAAQGGESPFPLWDFAVYNEFTTETVPPPGDIQTKMRWHWDPSHYKKELGNLILDRIFYLQAPEGVSYRELGMLLNSGNIEEHLQKIRSDQRYYHDTHPADITEIQTLVKKLGVMSKN